MSLKEKRIRSINWDEEEKQLFRSVLKEFATIIENKSLDNNTIKLKTKAWEEIHKKFNELNGRIRSLNQLKIQWKGMKIHARKEVNLSKSATNKTGDGGRAQTSTNDVIKINDLLNPAALLRDKNIDDSDGIIKSASTSKDLSASETCIFTLQDIAENIVQSDVAVCENIILEKREAGSMSVVNVVEDHVPAASQGTKPHEHAVRKESSASMIFKHLKRKKESSKLSSCSAKSNNYVNTMVNYTKSLKDQEHQKRLEILEVELNIQKEKLRSAILEREILEIRKAKELM